MIRLLIILVGLLPGISLADKNFREGWVFSPMVGAASPNMEAMYNEVFVAPFRGVVQILADLPEDVEAENRYPSEVFLFENSLDPVPVGASGGIEFRRRFSPKHDFLIGIGAWEISSVAETSVIFPLQGQINNTADYERRGKFSYTEYFLGVRQYLYERGKSRRWNGFVNLSLHEIFDIDYKETHVFYFTSGKPAGFSRNIINQAQATGLMLFEFGLGGEFWFGDRFSISMDGSYAFSVIDGVLHGNKERTDFNAGDQIDVRQMPVGGAEGEVTQVLTQDGTSYKEDIPLQLDGWKAAVKFNIYF